MRAGWDELRLRLVGTADDLDADIEAVRRKGTRRLSASPPGHRAGVP
jgi:hypothetical protein